jgi:ribonucleoside-triphosphate reductase
MNKIIEGYLDKSDWRILENSNMGYSLQGLNSHVTSELIKDYWLKKVYPAYISDSHLSGDIHIHDLGSISSYCSGWDLYDILIRGFSGVSDKISCKPPKHYRSFLGQIVNFLFTLQGEVAGAVAFSSFDTYLAPFISHDKLSYTEIKQGMQEFIFNMNVPTRVGFQQVFSNLTFDLVCPNHLKHTPVIVGGSVWGDKVYGDFQSEMDMVNKAFCEVMTDGDGSGAPFSFPIPTYNLTKKFNWESEVTKYIFTLTGKYGSPYFANYINSDMSPEDTKSMCCRLRINLTKIKRGGLFSSNPLTGSTGVVTINLPAIAYRNKSKGKLSFYKDLSKKLDIAKRSLEIKREHIEQWMEDGLYPYSKVYLQNVKKRVGLYFANHFSTIGILGGHEACLNFLGVGIETDRGKKFMQGVLEFIKVKIERFQKDGSLFNLEATPGEGTSFCFAMKDLQRYKDIQHSGVKKSPYYTNSTQLPVGLDINILEALHHQNDLQVLYSGGTVEHIFLGESVDNIEVLKKLVKKVAENYEIPYFSITPTFSTCPEHGYIKGRHENCPKCGNPCMIYSRIVGYYRPVSGWNIGKKQEFKERKVFSLDGVDKDEKN